MSLRRRAASGAVADLLVVGLGNPGEKYADTRHNAGVWVAEELLRRHGGSLRRSRRVPSLTCETRVSGRLVAVAVPTTWMNESGRAVAPLVRRLGITDLSALLVAHDDLDLAVGRLKVKAGGGLAGHNGLKSIRAHLRSDAFTRVRIGVGRPAYTPHGGDYVLKRPRREQRAELDAAVGRAVDAIGCLLEHGIDTTMDRFNSA